ncbi:MAG: hypothetical protein ACI9MB_001605, partial [Verrucomicrobiales bacterium]
SGEQGGTRIFGILVCGFIEFHVMSRKLSAIVPDW